MKTSCFFIALISLSVMFSVNAYAQSEEYECGTIIDPDSTQYAMELEQLGGKYITADGVLKALIVFVQYRGHRQSQLLARWRTSRLYG